MTTIASTTNLVLSPERGLTSAPGASEREKLHEAAQHFEAIFVRQMLAEARKTSFDSEGIFSSGALQTFRQMQDDQFADLAAKTGALGLASVIEAQLARHLPPETDAPSTTATGES